MMRTFSYLDLVRVLDRRVRVRGGSGVGVLGLTALGLVLEACGGGGGGTDPKTDNKAPKFGAIDKQALGEGVTPTGGIKDGKLIVSVGENKSLLGTFAATDEDGDKITYSLKDGGDKDKFEIESTTGRLSFKKAPDFETPTDSNTDNVYSVTIVATDGKEVGTEELSLEITVTDENDNAPMFVSGLATTMDVAENTKTVGTYLATDADGGTITYSLEGDDGDKFDFDSTTGELTFKSIPDYETPGSKAGTNVYKVTIVASDGTDTAEHAITVTVTDVDETGENSAPTFASASPTMDVAENDTSVGTYEATDTDAGDMITYTLSGADRELFKVSDGGELSFKDAPDYENPTDSDSDNVYNVTITATDIKGGMADHALAVMVTDVNEVPKFGSDVMATASIAENTKTVGTFTATDEDDGDTITYSLKGGVDKDKFEIEPTTGRLSFKTAPDYENPTDDGGDNIYNVTIVATDSKGATAEHSLEVTVTDIKSEGSSVPKVVRFISTNSIEENVSKVGTYKAFTEVANGIVYTLSGADRDLFSIGNGGELSFKSAPDYENPTDDGGDNIYNVTIVATDSKGATAEHSLEFTVTDVNEAPRFGSGLPHDKNVRENSRTVGRFTATDDEGDKITYKLLGDDASKFFLYKGVLYFWFVPNYESPGSKAGTNVYELTIKATSQAGGADQTSEHALVVRVINSNEAPKFDSSLATKVRVSENTKTVGTFVATDVDAGDTITYGLKGGVDKDKFEIEPTTGRLTFKSPPDYETPSSAAGTNVYEVTITATDTAGATAKRAIVVTVRNVSREGEVGTDGDDTITGTDSNDTLQGGGGDDTLQGGLGNDIYIFIKGDGRDTIEDTGGSDKIRFVNIDLDSILLEFSGDEGNDLLVTFRDDKAPDTVSATDKVTIKGGNTVLGRIESFEIKDGRAAGVTYDVSGITGVQTGTSNVDTLTGTAEADWLSSGGGNDTLFGGASDDFLFGGHGDDVYRYGKGDGKDIISDTEGSDTIKFEGIELDSVLPQFSGNDLLIKFRDSADYNKVSLTDMLRIKGGKTGGRIEKFHFGEKVYDISNVTVFRLGTVRADRMAGTDVADWLSGGSGDDRLLGEKGDDYLLGGVGYDVIYGGEGDDMLFGGEGNDTLLGGKGNDTMYGGEDDDTYREVGRDYGIKVVEEEGGSKDKLIFEKTTYKQTNIRSVGDDLVITFKDYAGSENDKLTIKNWNVDPQFRVELFVFTDGDYEYAIEGGNTTLVPREVYEYARGDGELTITDEGGLDVISFWRINLEDVILERSGDSGEDILLKFRDWTDHNSVSTTDLITLKKGTLESNRIEYLEFDTGTYDIRDISNIETGGDSGDDLSGTAERDWLSGGGGDDTLSGGKGDDYLFGGEGSDVYHFRRGDGHDIIYDYGGANDVINFDSEDNAISYDNVEGLYREGRNLIMRFKGYDGAEKDKLTIQNWQDTNNVTFSKQAIETFIFGGRSKKYAYKYNMNAITKDKYLSLSGYGEHKLLEKRVYNYERGDGGITISGATGVEMIKFGGVSIDSIVLSAEGNDLRVRFLDESIVTVEGRDTVKDKFSSTDFIVIKGGIYGGRVEKIQTTEGVFDVSDIFYTRYRDGTLGSDWVYGNAVGDLVRGEGPHAWLVGGNDYAIGRGGSDHINGGPGSDHLFGGKGNDKILGDHGHDYLNGGPGNDNMDGEYSNDTLYGGSGNDYMKGSGGTDTLYGEEGNDRMFGGWGHDTLYGGEGNDRLYGDSGNDILSGGEGNDSLRGGTGDDYLYGGSDNDNLYGELGDDRMWGGSGDDVYVFSIDSADNEGADTITEELGSDTIRLGTDSTQRIDTSKVSFVLSGSTLKITYGTGSITVKKWNDSAFRIERIQYYDSEGKLKTFSGLNSKTFTTTAKTLSDLIRGKSEEVGFDDGFGDVYVDEDVDLLGLYPTGGFDLI